MFVDQKLVNFTVLFKVQVKIKSSFCNYKRIQRLLTYLAEPVALRYHIAIISYII